MNFATAGLRFAAIAAAALPLALGLSSCATESASEPPATAGEQVEPAAKVKYGKKFTVVLKSYPKQGKVWSFDQERTTGSVKLISTRYRRSAMPENDSRFFKPVSEAADECEQEFVFKRTGWNPVTLQFNRANSENDQQQDFQYKLSKAPVF